MTFARGALTLILMAAPAGMAVAQPRPVAAASAPDAQSMVIARKIIAIILPPDRIDATVNRMAEAIARPMAAQWRRQITTSDLGLIAIVDEFMAKIPVVVRETMVPMMPDLTEAMARAYARQFSRDELAQILAFGQTPAGARYLGRASDVLQDADVQAFYARLMPAAQAREAPLLAECKAKLDAYMAAHPELAKNPHP
jgi:hypothetical protein